MEKTELTVSMEPERLDALRYFLAAKNKRTPQKELQRALERATELQTQVDAMNRANAVRAVRDKVSAATGVPAGLLSGESEEDCTAQAQAILEFARPGYPSVRDGGEADARRREQQDDGVMAAFRQLNPKLEV